MSLANEQPAARAQQRSDDRGPASDVGQPAQRSDSREDEVEDGSVHGRRGVVHVRLHEDDVARGVSGQPSGLGDRGRREVQPGHPGSEPGERDRVGSDMALQMDPGQARDVPQPWQVEPDDLADERGILAEPLQCILGRPGVGWCSFVPVRAVDVPVVGHVPTVPDPTAGAAVRARRRAWLIRPPARAASASRRCPRRTARPCRRFGRPGDRGSPAAADSCGTRSRRPVRRSGCWSRGRCSV